LRQKTSAAEAPGSVGSLRGAYARGKKILSAAFMGVGDS
jgi:hypothetical protein